MRHAIVFGAGGFIGSHMVKRLKSEGYWVRGVDQKTPEFSATEADEFLIGDLRDYSFVQKALEGDLPVDELYQFAADMGGAGFVFTGDNDAEIMHNSATINLNTLDIIQKNYSPPGGVLKYFTQAVRACIPSTIN
jgi:nucleoside-diphosphate-sugar epimerase